MDNAAKLDAICKERAELRGEILEMQKSMHRVLFAFISVAALIAGLYWDTRVVPTDEVRRLLFMFLTQVEVGFAVFMIVLTAHQNISAGYIAALEARITELCEGDRIAIFESVIVPRFIQSWRSSFFWGSGLILVGGLATFVFLILISRPFPEHWLFGTFLIAESVIVLALFLWAGREKTFVERYAARHLTKERLRK